MSRVTASRLALLQACQYWARPDAVWNEAPPGRAAQFGTDLHALSDVYVRGEPGSASWVADGPLLDAWRHMRAWLDATMATVALSSEWPLAWDPETDRAFDLRRALARRGIMAARPYADPSIWALLRAELGFGPSTIAGTADLVEAGECMVVYDICTGSTDKIAQLRGLAMMLAKLTGCEEVRIATLRVNPSGLAEEDHGVLDCFTIEAIAEDLRALVANVPRSEPRTGEHCARRYCPAQRDCPGFGDLTAPG